MDDYRGYEREDLATPGQKAKGMAVYIHTELNLFRLPLRHIGRIEFHGQIIKVGSLAHYNGWQHLDELRTKVRQWAQEFEDGTRPMPALPVPRMLTHNDRYHCVGLGTVDSVCKLRIYQTASGIVVVVSEREDNEGMSVTNAVERLYRQVCRDFQIDPAQTTWIEHYPERGTPYDRLPEDFSVVWLDHNEPVWDYRTREQVELLIGMVVDL